MCLLKNFLLANFNYWAKHTHLHLHIYYKYLVKPYKEENYFFKDHVIHRHSYGPQIEYIFHITPQSSFSSILYPSPFPYSFSACALETLILVFICNTFFKTLEPSTLPTPNIRSHSFICTSWAEALQFEPFPLGDRSWIIWQLCFSSQKTAYVKGKQHNKSVFCPFQRKPSWVPESQSFMTDSPYTQAWAYPCWQDATYCHKFYDCIIMTI